MAPEDAWWLGLALLPPDQAAETMVQEAATAGRVRIANELSEGGSLLRADARILRQLLLILLSNAIRFTPRDLYGSIIRTVVISLHATDAGPAIGPDDIARLEGDFGAADAALARIRGGTGFSLSSEGATGMTATVTFPPERVLADSEDPLPTARPAVSRTEK